MNLKWYNRAYVYFHKNKNAGGFIREFNFMRWEIGLIGDGSENPYESKAY